MWREIVTIGNELTSGKTLDLNAWYAAGRLTASGLRITRITSVGDDYAMVAEALMRAMKESRFVIITGGLGSTEDDITNEIVAKVLNRPLKLNKRMLDLIRAKAKERGVKLTKSVEKMAWLPDGAKILSPEGRSCGFFLMEKDVRLYFLPGVPEQMRYLINRFVIPDLLNAYDTVPVIRQRILKVYGLNEPELADIFSKLKKKTGNVIFGFYPHFPENHITLSLTGDTESTVDDELDRVEALVSELLGTYLFAKGNETMEEVVGKLLIKYGLSLGAAESCTGGLIGHRITNVSGSSQYFQGGVVCYSNESKVKILDVNQKTLARYGAVSLETAAEMASGIKKLLKAHLGIAVTGIAGPTGGTKEKPVGTVCFGLACDGEIFTRQYRFWGTRDQIKTQSSTMALDWIRRYVTGNPFLPGI